jgi:uncharacterized protein involved in response to NO
VGVVLATPFRLFFLLAAIMSALWMPVWGLVWLEGQTVATDLTPLGWHVHEMVFGYVGAVVAGFVLTAARSWTGRETLRGWSLALLIALWCAGRVVAGQGARWPAWVGPVVDGSFYALVAFGAGRAVIGARSWRNLGILVVIAVLGACDVIVHLYVHGHLGLGWGIRAFDVALDVIVVLIILFGGRIVPLFTKNAVGGVRDQGVLDRAGLIAVWAWAAMDVIAPAHALGHGLAIAAGLLNAARLIGWGGSRTLGKPILWVLHLGWLLLALGLIAVGVSGFWDRIPPSAATHLMTVGGIGLVTLGMMARVSLGHTGRELRVPRVVAIGFGFLIVATVARVAAGFSRSHYDDLIWLAALSWAAGFAAFALRYAPILLSPRADGKPG